MLLKLKNAEKEIKKKVFHKIKKVAKDDESRRLRRIWVEKCKSYSRNINCITCFYCMQKRHTSKKCRIKHFDVPNGIYAWVPTIN